MSMSTQATSVQFVQIDRFVHNRLPPEELSPQRIYPPKLDWLRLCKYFNLVDHLFLRAEECGWRDQPFLRSPTLTLSYAQVKRQVDQLAKHLTQDLGLITGNRVLLRGVNSIGMCVAWLAVVKAGMIAVSTMPLLRTKELSEILAKANPSVALCQVELMADLQSAQQQTGIHMPIEPFTAHPFTLSELDVKAHEDHHTDIWTSTAADDIALIAFTSGTTGPPKAVVHSHRDVLAACEAWPRHVLRATSDDIVMGTPPLAFTFGLGGLLIFPMWAGASVYFPNAPLKPEQMVQQLIDVGASICYTAPTYYRQMAAFIQPNQAPKLRLCVSAGEFLPDATRQLWKVSSGLDLIDGIGATEMFHIFISSAPDDLRKGAIGRVVPGYEAKVVDEAGIELPRGSLGHLIVRGPTGCRYMDDVRQENYVKNGWNYSGDTFVEDADGYFYYRARNDDMIISAGYNISGAEIEDAILSHPAVLECGVVARSDEMRGMIVKAFCVLRTDIPTNGTARTNLIRDLQDHVKAELAPYKYPREIEFVEKLPRTETGKLQRFVLRQMASAKEVTS